MMKKTLVLFCMGILFLSSCSYDLSRSVVQQGNLLPAAKVKRLRVGMSKEEAAILLGTSLISPMFNNNRWDYAYTYRKGGGPLQKQNVVLFFNHGVLAHIEHHP